LNQDTFLAGAQNESGHELHHTVSGGIDLLDGQNNIQVPNELVVEGFFSILTSRLSTLLLNLAKHYGILAMVGCGLLTLLKDVGDNGAEGLEDRLLLFS
jgi:hypothetical protein